MQDIKPLIFDSSRRSAMHSVDAIIKNPSLLKAFIDLAFRDVHQFSMRAANVIEKYDAKVPCVTESYLDAILQHIIETKNEGVKRCFLKLFTHYSFEENEKIQGLLVNYCFQWLSSTDESIAIRYYCMHILYSISNYIPELKPELAATIEIILEQGDKSLKTQGGKFLRKLNKEMH